LFVRFLLILIVASLSAVAEETIIFETDFANWPVQNLTPRFNMHGAEVGLVVETLIEGSVGLVPLNITDILLDRANFTIQINADTRPTDDVAIGAGILTADNKATLFLVGQDRTIYHLVLQVNDPGQDATPIYFDWTDPPSFPIESYDFKYEKIEVVRHSKGGTTSVLRGVLTVNVNTEQGDDYNISQETYDDFVDVVVGVLSFTKGAVVTFKNISITSTQ